MDKRRRLETKKGSEHMRGTLGGLLAGGLVSVLGLGTASLLSEQPAGVSPPDAPLVDAPQVENVMPTAEGNGPSSPVGSFSIDEPQAPDLPEAEGGAQDLAVPDDATSQAAAPRADTDPLDEPEVSSIEGAMEAPEASQEVAFDADPVEPVLPNPQGQAPVTPNVEADLTVSTAPAQPVVVVDEPESGVVVQGSDAVVAEPDVEPQEDTFVIDLGADEAAEAEAAPQEEVVAGLSPVAEAPELVEPEGEPAPRLQLQGGENSLLGDRDTGVNIRRPGADTADAEQEGVVDVSTAGTNALVDFAADAGDFGSMALLSVVLIDDGSMSAAAAALSGLPFTVTVALDPAMENAAELMERYRADGFEVVALAKLPDGALPSDVEVTFESVFGTLPDAVAVLDTGNGGLQSDRAVTEQAMEILASQGRGFINTSQGLNMAGRAAGEAGVPAAAIYRDLDSDGQDARIVRRFFDQAAFQARRESGVVLVGRVRPDTISALILWGTANRDDQVAIVPVSAVLNAQ